MAERSIVQRSFAYALALASLAGCGSINSSFGNLLEPDRIDYKSASTAASKTKSLEVPPDLTQLQRDNRYALPESASRGTATASGFNLAQSAAPAAPSAATAVAPRVTEQARVERDGSQRWLVVKMAPEALWPQVKEFWQDSGFLIATENQEAGVMETDWAENRAKIPQDIIRSTLGKFIDTFYSTAERDRFRTRLERSPTGATEIYISHRGMQEVYSNQQKDSTVWQPRPTDPELEAEFLRRLMVKLGVTQEQARTVAATAPQQASSRVASVNNQPVVVIDENFDRAWRRVGLALDRTGFTVEDRDRSQGTYFVRYVAPNADRREPGLLSRIFGRGDSAEQPVKYRIALRTEGERTTVSVLNANGAPEASANAQRIVQVIADDLK
jgi:outer membrane protein assembly factor BamC